MSNPGDAAPTRFLAPRFTARFPKARPLKTSRRPLSVPHRKRAQAGDLRSLLPSHRVPNVPVHLKSEPGIRRHPQHPLQTERGVRSEGALSPHNFVEPREGDSEADREGRLADAERPKKLLQEHLARVRRRPAAGKPSAGFVNAADRPVHATPPSDSLQPRPRRHSPSPIGNGCVAVKPRRAHGPAPPARSCGAWARRRPPWRGCGGCRPARGRRGGTCR